MRKTLTLDVKKSSVSEEVVNFHPEIGPLELTVGEPLKLRIFVDRSVVEVFANGRQCVTKRIYPSRPDSLGVGLFTKDGRATLRSMNVWQMAAVWPYIL